MTRILVVLAALTAAVVTMLACSPDATNAGDVCAQATTLFEQCGASLPILGDGPCTGIRKAVATCVANHVSSCDDLGGLFGHVDECVSDALDGGVSLVPPDNLPVPSVDGAVPADVDAGSTPDASSVLDGSDALDAGDDDTSDGDAGMPDAAPDGAPPTAWSGITVSGTLAYGEQSAFHTPTLPPGSYSFDMTGTGDADLYVEIGAPPSTTSFDCHPDVLNSSDESCVAHVTAPSVVYVMVRGFATSSTFTVHGHS